MPILLPVGSRDVSALQLILRHPGPSFVGAIRCVSLGLQCRDAHNALLAPATYLYRARVLQRGVEVGIATGLPISPAKFTVALSGIVVDPAASDTLELRIDIDPSAPLGTLELRVASDAIVAIDDKLGSPTLVIAEPGTEFPLSSGLAQLQVPARAIAVSMQQMMPAVLVADGRPTPVARLTLQNTAPASSGFIRVDHLELMAGDRNGSRIPIGASVERVRVFIADSLWADSGPVPASASSVVLAAPNPLSILPTEPIAVEARITLRTGTTVAGLRIGCDAAGIGVIQPVGTLLSILVLPEAGQSFPLWTEPGSIAALSLPQSYSNFPNPFAAGRGLTTFAFFLPKPGRVTLSLWTSQGDRVRTLLEGARMDQGLHQDATWDGRNGDRNVVVNGAYLAEIEIAYEDGTRDRAVRKVAVAR